MAEDDDIYNTEQREEQEADDEISPVEEGFMKGYEEKDSVDCAQCRKVIVEEGASVDQEIDGETVRFCSEHCADKYKRK
jgi:YHS domain-containing protein